MATIGIIGGSGLYAMPGLEVRERRAVTTPFGEPSDPLVMGVLHGVEVVFIPRHGEGHRFTPSEVNYRANVWALKAAGCSCALSVSAVGSLQAKHAPGLLYLPHQFIDRTHRRESSFFGQGLVAHVGFAEPTSAWLRHQLLEAAKGIGLPLGDGGTYVNMEGPQFSSRAESRLHQSWGADFIGMTQATEAKLFREAELPWACIALVTDYDAWRDDEAVETHDVLSVMAANVSKAQDLLRSVLPLVQSGPPAEDPALDALKFALLTSSTKASPEAKSRLALLVARYGY